MPTQPLTIQVPTRLYEHLKELADQTQRSVEEETLEVLAGAVPADDTLPPELESVLASLGSQDDASLWDAARSRLPAGISERFEELHARQRREGLTAAESAQLVDLVVKYERQMLVRAEALALLKQRGHDVRELVGS